MIVKHLKCDGCGDVTLDAEFNSGSYCDTDGTFDYSKIVSDDVSISQPVSNTDWVREAQVNEDDPISVTFNDYCPDCQ